MTQVPMPTFGDAGFSSPTELANLQGVLADFNDAFGGNLNTNLDTPQGQMATSLAAVISAFNDYFVDYTNQVDPAFASGRMQDAIGHIYYLSRRGATPTTVIAEVSGVTGLVLPVGSLAKTTDGYIFQSLQTVTIPATGSVEVPFAALETGPISVPAGALNTIYRTVVGWDSITNSTAGALGRDVESRADFETRRGLSVAGNATGILPAIRGAVLSVPGIVDAYVTENSTGASVTTGGQTLVAHSLYVAVQGGSDADVAQAIWSKKPPGCAYNGTTSVTVTDTESGYLTPPTYTVKFQRAAALTINYTVEIASNPGVPGDVALQVQNAITAAFPEQARIGQTIYASAMVCPVAAIGTWARVRSIEVNSADTQAVGIGQFPVLGTVTVTVT